MSSRSLQATLGLCVLLLPMLLLKCTLNNTVHHYSIDGGYYTEVASHIRDGEGLVTRVSLYNKGYTYFPHPTVIYPLWPLLLGYAAKIVPLEQAAVWLPSFLYLLSLLLGYQWANLLSPAPLLKKVPSLRAGHLFVLFLGINPSFFYFTSLPYTEGLAFSLLLVFWWRLATLLESPNVLSGLETGIWLALLLLTRSQWIFVTLAVTITITLAACLSEARASYGKMGLATLVGLMAIFLPYWLEASRGLVDNSIWTYLNFSSARPNNLLNMTSQAISDGGIKDRFFDFLNGIGIAYDPFHRKGFTQIFSLFIFGLPLAVLIELFQLCRRRPEIKRALQRAVSPLSQPRMYAWLTVALFALANLALVHGVKSSYSVWYFYRRHAIPIVFAIFPAFLYLLHSPWRWAKRLALILIILGTLHSSLVNVVRWKLMSQPSAIEAERWKLAKWLQTKQKEFGKLTVAITDNEAQQIAWRTDQVNYHGITRGTGLDRLRIMHDVLGVEYLILKKPRDSESTKLEYPPSLDVKEEKFAHLYRRLASPDGRFEVYVWLNATKSP